MPPAALPALAFTTADGVRRTLADYAGRGVILNFWATWCTPCVSEMPALDALAGAMAASKPPMTVLAVSLDRAGAAAVTPFYASHGIRNLPVLLDPHSETMMALRLDGIPTTLVIDRGGQEVAPHPGPSAVGRPRCRRVVATDGRLAASKTRRLFDRYNFGTLKRRHLLSIAYNNDAPTGEICFEGLHPGWTDLP